MISFKKVLFSIVNYNSIDDTMRILSVLNNFANKKKYLLSVFVFNNSTSEKFIKSNLIQRYKYLNLNLHNSPTNIGYAPAQNFIYRKSNSFDHLLFINPDLYLTVSQLDFFFFKARKVSLDYGQISCSMKHGINGPIYTSIAEVRDNFKIVLCTSYKKINHKNVITHFVCGAFVLFNKKSLHNVGGFDSNFFLYWDDVDISYRLQLAGYKFYSIILNDPLIHSVGGSSKTLISRLIKFYFFYKGKILFLKKHKGFKLATKISFIT